MIRKNLMPYRIASHLWPQLPGGYNMLTSTPEKQMAQNT